MYKKLNFCVAFCRKQVFSKLRLFLLLFLPLLSLPVVAQSADPIAELDSLLNLYEGSSGAARQQAGRKVMELCSKQEVFFVQLPALDQRLSARQQDLCVWYAAERYLTTCSYYKEALQYIGRAFASLSPEPQALQDSLHCTLLCDQAYCLFKTSDYTSAVEAAQQAKERCQQAGNILQLSRAYLYLSMVNHSLRNYDEAKDQVVKAIETNMKMGLNDQTHNVLGVACELFCSAKEVDQAIAYGKQAVEAARELGLMSAVANHLTQLSYAYDRKGDYEQGLQVADEAIAIVQDIEPMDRNQLALTLEFKSWNLIDLKRNAEAVEALREAIRLEEAVGNASAVRYDYRTLSEALEPIDMQESLKALKRSLVMTDSLHTVQLNELTSQANAELHNDELKEENAESLRMNRIIITTSLIIMLLLVAVIASLWFAFRQKRRTANALRRLTEARELFFTNVTHEFRTPLTVVLGIGRELKDEPHPQEDVLHEMGESIERQGTRLLMLMNQMLDISKEKSAIEPWQAAKSSASTESARETETPESVKSPELSEMSEASKFTVLVVDDNSDIAHLIGRQLSNHYIVRYAYDGEEGIRRARQLVPDIIITDVMMPHTDGLELCRTLRQDPVTNHIPIIVVTAKATDADRIKGLQAGADAYLYKPFNEEELLVRIEKLLELRGILRQKYSTAETIQNQHVSEEDGKGGAEAQENVPATHSSSERPVNFAQQSQDFVQTIDETVIRLITQGNCTVDAVAEELFVTPSQLRRKMASITGMTPKRYIMKVRLEYAKDMMMRHPDMKLLEVAEQCGFSDLSHFIRLYKEAYGNTPATDHRK